jgi:hypothetical protein
MPLIGNWWQLQNACTGNWWWQLQNAFIGNSGGNYKMPL